MSIIFSLTSTCCDNSWLGIFKLLVTAVKPPTKIEPNSSRIEKLNSNRSTKMTERHGHSWDTLIIDLLGVDL